MVGWDYLALCIIFILSLFFSSDCGSSSKDWVLRETNGTLGYLIFLCEVGCCVRDADIVTWMQFAIYLLYIKKRVSNILLGRLLRDQVSTVRKEELKVIFLWWCWRKIDHIKIWELSNICSVNGNRSEWILVGSGGSPHTNTWRHLL